MATTVQRLPRLRQRVVEPPGFVAPRWADDPHFDLDFHVRDIALPAPATDRELFELTALTSTDPFDRARPLWQFLIVNGLAGGRGAFIQKLHHTIADGQAGIRLSERSLRRRLEGLSIPLDRAQAATTRLGGTVNDLFVTGAVGAAGAYHRARGVEVEDLRMAMAGSTRGGGDERSNAFAPCRLLVPAGIVEPRGADRRRAGGGARGPGRAGSTLAPQLAGMLHGLPGPVLQKAARQQVGTVDVTTSNLRGAPFELYVAGARILANHPVGPMTGTAFNLTTMSMAGRLDMGLLIDEAAVGDPGLLRNCLVAAYGELLALA